MIGIEKKTAGGVYLPDMTHPVWRHVGKTGLLPPIAGASPSYWSLVVPHGESLVRGENTNSKTASVRINLLAEQSPTIMETWDLYDIRVPLSVFMNLEGAEGYTILTTLTLYCGGEICWSYEEDLKDVSLPANRILNFIAAANLQNPIHVDHGRTLELEGRVVVTMGTTAGKLAGFIKLGVSSTVKEESEISVEAQKMPIAQGMIHYYSSRLTGHRTL